MHISNYSASEEEMKLAAKLCHDRPLTKVNLAYVNNISKKLHSKMTDLIYNLHDDNFAKYQSHRRIIPNYEFSIDLTPYNLPMVT